MSAAPEPIGTQSVDAYLAALGSGTPAPGGGSAAAIAGALGAALVAMAGRVTAARDASATDAAAIADEADAIRRDLLVLADEDARAYTQVIAARRRPEPERGPALAAAIEGAIDVPARLAAASGRALALCERIAPAARASTLGDLHVAALLAHAGLRAGVLTARVNLADVADAARRRTLAERLEALADEARARADRVEAQILRRTSRAA